MRRRQNNPILTGEAGVGKTAVVEGFAHRIVAGDVPPALKDVSVRTLDIGLLQAGASMKGEFEQRLRAASLMKSSIAQADHSVHRRSPHADRRRRRGGTGDAANLLKPALARGTLRTVAATTWDEYKKHIEKDPALTRRFQVVKVEEPGETKCILMMRGMWLRSRNITRCRSSTKPSKPPCGFRTATSPARQLPDKAVSLIDTAAARVAVSQHAVPRRSR